MYYLSSPFSNKMLIDNSKGSAQKGIYLSTLKNISIPITNLDEQNAIVSQIEMLFSKLNEAENGLKTTIRSLKIYRQALLKNAFEGVLTKNWRKDLSIDAYQELTDIKIKRKDRYEAEIKNKKAARFLT